MVRSLSFVQRIVKWLWFLIYDGDEISEWYEVIICSGNVVSVYLLTDRNYVDQHSSNIRVPYRYLLLSAWVEFSSGIARSRKVVSNRHWQKSL